VNSLLNQLRNVTTVVADTGELSAIKTYSPEDATTNPTLILKAVSSHEYGSLLDAVIQQTKQLFSDLNVQIEAAEQLEKEGINCNLTLLFSFAQARACAEANVFLISPFVGRIMDWYKDKTSLTYNAETDPGVLAVKAIHQYYKQHGYKTVVMGASFRNLDEMLALAGCDRLTIPPNLLQELDTKSGVLVRRLVDDRLYLPCPAPLSEAEFRWEHNEDVMATEKLAEGIRNFTLDQMKLELFLANRLIN